MEDNSGDVDVRNYTAKIVYLSSFALVIFELAVDARSVTMLELFTLLTVIFIKPILLVSGEASQMPIFLCLLQLIMLKVYL